MTAEERSVCPRCKELRVLEGHCFKCGYDISSKNDLCQHDGLYRCQTDGKMVPIGRCLWCELEWVNAVNAALLPYQERAIKAEQRVESAEKMALGLRSILVATDQGALYGNRALHLAAGEALGLEGYSSED